MPNIIIDNSLDFLNIAITRYSAILAERSIGNTRTPSSIIATELSNTMEDAHVTFPDISEIFVTLGPGSFTGIRVSLAFCKGISAARSIPLTGLPTLDVLAYPFSIITTMDDSFICPLIDAKKGEVFACLYHVSKGVIKNITGYRSLKPADVPAFIQIPCVCSGTGTDLLEPFLRGIEGVTVEKEAHRFIEIPALNAIATALTNKPVRHEIKPIYGRKSEAEIKFNVTVD